MFRREVRPKKQSVKALAPALLTTFLVVLGTAGCGSGSAKDSTTQAPVETTVPTSVAREPVTHDFVIPAGTGTKIALRQDVDVLPEWLDVHVGDMIRVRNDDDELIRLGIFDVRPGETITMNFNVVGRSTNVVYSDQSGGCGVPPPNAKKFTINVQP